MSDNTVTLNSEYFEAIRAWIKQARDKETDEFGFHPCAPHERHQHDACLELCMCGHTCHDHMFLDGTNLRGPKPTMCICVEHGCSCKMFRGGTAVRTYPGASGYHRDM